MLRKMYLVSPDYLGRNERPATTRQPLPKIAPSTKQKKKRTRAVRVKRKKKGALHPYDKWVAMRSEIAEAAVGRKALIKAIADFIKVVLPNTTLSQKVPTPRSRSVEEGTQTLHDLKQPSTLRFEPLPSTSSAGDVYETETSPLSAGFTLPPRPTTLSYDDDDDGGDTGAVSKDVDVDTGGVSEGKIREYARNAFGPIASPYLSPYVHKSGILDAEYGLRKVGDRFFIGNSDVSVDTNSDFYIRNKRFKGTRGLWELLTRKKVNSELVTPSDLRQYKRILILTSAHLERYEPGAPIHISRGNKFRSVIAKLFPQTKQRNVEKALHQQWEKY